MAKKKVDYVVRMQDEAKALRSKMYALKGFLGGTDVHNLPAEKQALMKDQLGAMQHYNEILNKRIALEE